MKKIIAICMAVSLLTLVACSTDEGLNAQSSSLLGGQGQSAMQQGTDQQSGQMQQGQMGTMGGMGEMGETEETEDEQVFSQDPDIASLDFPSFDYTDEMGDAMQVAVQEEILITDSGTYEFSGTYSNTTITVEVDKDKDDGIVYLVFNGASITSSTGTPINIIEAQDVVIVLSDGTQNSVSQGAISTTDEDFPSGAIYSKADTVITGAGTLTVTTLYNDGIVSKDDLIIDGSTIVVDAAADGIVAKDLLAIQSASITITAGKDGMKTTNTDDLDKGNMIILSGSFVIDAACDGISAEHTLQVDGGDFTITAGGGFDGVLNTITLGEGSSSLQATDLLEESMKGIKGDDLLFNGGTFTISAYEDTVHSDHNIIVNGGTFALLSGDDGMTAGYALTINDGEINIENAYEGIEAAYLTINGGSTTVNVLDDALNGNGDVGLLLINGGYVRLTCQGDGIDGNNDVTIAGGEIIIEANSIYTGGDGAIDVSGTLTVTGGTIVDEEGNAISTSTSGSMGGSSSKNNMMQQRR